jgi:hypothetical protein
MKRLSLLFVLTFILFSSLYSQEKIKSKEVGLYFSSLDAFGIRYKFGNEKHMLRLTALSLSGGSYSNDIGNGSTQNQSSFGAGLSFGIEFPVKITDNFNFYYGGQLGTSYYYSKNETTSNDASKVNSFGGSAGFILGFMYSINSSISLSAEIVPAINYNYSKQGESTSSGFGFGLNNATAGLTLGYRF